MGWGSPLGFSSGKSPFEKVTSAIKGQPGWYVRMRERPTAEFPFRAWLTTPCGSAVFNDADHARLWEHHGGEIGELAIRYLRWRKDGTDPREGEA